MNTTSIEPDDFGCVKRYVELGDVGKITRNETQKRPTGPLHLRKRAVMQRNTMKTNSPHIKTNFALY